MFKMTYYYSLPNFTDSYLDIFTYANSTTGNLWGIVSLLTFFLVIYIPMNKKYPFEISLTVASFAATIFSYFAFLLGWVGSHITLFPLIIFLLSIFLHFRRR